MATVTVQRGDTLSSIAARYGMTWQQFAEANKGVISNPNLIYSGMTLNVPSGASGQQSGDKVPDPNMYTINFKGADLSPERLKELEDEAYNELSGYYERVLNEARGDVELAKKRMQEDYVRGTRLKTEDVATAIRRATEDTGLSKEQNADNLALAKDTLKYLDNVKFPVARKVLDTTFNSRGLFSSGLYGQGKGELAMEQGLERKQQTTQISGLQRNDLILDMALERTKEDENKGLTRYIDEMGITRERGNEDMDRELSRREWELEQQRRKEAVGIAQSKSAREQNNAELDRLYG